MSETYNVVYTGTLRPEVGLEEAVAAFAARFGAHPQKVRELLGAESEVTLQSGLSAAQAAELRRAVERIGLVARIDPAVHEAGAADASASGDGAGGGPPVPAAEGPPADRFHDPRRVPASHGWRWLKEGFAMVFAGPAAWIGALLVWMVLNFLLSLIPLVNFLAALVAAVFMGGIMMGAHEQVGGGRFRVGHLFAGFSDRFGPLFLVGVLYLLGSIAVFLVLFLVMGGLFAAYGGLSGAGPEAVDALAAGPAVWLPVLVTAVLILPLIMAYWFAPVLVAVDGVSPLRAMRMSLRACLRNILPFLVYGLIALVLFMIGAIPLLLGLLLVVPGTAASVYASYRDVFRA